MPKAKKLPNTNPGALGFITIPSAPLKPRKNRWTKMSDRTIPLGYQKDMLEMIGDLIDRAKLSDHVGLIGRFSPQFIRKKNALYKKYGVLTYPGGVPFELAYLQKKVKAFYESLPGLGFAGVEISADTIPPISRPERNRLIKAALKLGLEVHTEIGEKLSETTIQVQSAVDSIRADIDAGACKVAIENNDLIRLYRSSPKTIIEIGNKAGLENVVWEIGPAGWPDLSGFLLKEFGPDINIENIYPDQLIPFDSMRRGLSRLTGYTYLMTHPGR